MHTNECYMEGGGHVSSSIPTLELILFACIVTESYVALTVLELHM